MTTKQQKIQTIITTFSDDMYIIENKTPDQIHQLIDAGSDMVRMPNGSYIHKKSISGIQSYEDYNFQTQQRVFHKKGYHISNNSWHDVHGPLGMRANLESITGDLKNSLLGTAQKKLS